jgi:hypothetical protein
MEYGRVLRIVNQNFEYLRKCTRHKRFRLKEYSSAKEYSLNLKTVITHDFFYIKK